MRVAVGVALVVLAVRQWLSRGERSDTPAWMRSLGEATPRSAARLGVLLSAANPKILLLTAAAGLAIADAGATATEVSLAVVGFTLVASVTVALPLVGHLVLGERARTPLARAKDWLERHNAAVMAVVLLAIGLVLVRGGLSGL